MRISHFLQPDFVISPLGARDLDGVVQELAACAVRAGVGSEKVIAEKLLEREREHSTVMGAGLAIPHATVPGLLEPVIGVAVSPEPVQFGSEELDPVRVFFVLLSPPGRERDHVKLLARICRLGRHDDFLQQLIAATDGEEVVRVIHLMDAEHV